MPRPRKSPIHKYTKEQFISLCEGKIVSDIITEVFGELDRKTASTYYKIVRAKMYEFGMDYEKYKDDGSRQTVGIRKHNTETKRPTEEYLVYGSTIPSSRLKKRLISEGYLTEECSECGISDEWCGRQLVMQLDHIDGDCLNNTIDNLRLLCPNCHSQTDTFCKRK